MPRSLNIIFSWAICSTLVAEAKAQEDFFSDIEVSSTKTEKAQNPLRGFIKQSLHYGLQSPEASYGFERNQQGLEQVRTQFFLEHQNNFTQQISLSLSAKAEWDAMHWQANELTWAKDTPDVHLKDAYIDWLPQSGHWLRIGKQVFAWGESESLSITDVLSPNDQRVFGQAERQDLREHIPAAMYSLPALTGKLSLITSYQAGTHRSARSRDSFYPYLPFKNSDLKLIEKKPNSQWEYALKYDYHYNGGDLSLVIADTQSNEVFLQQDALNPTRVYLQQINTQILALSANRALGNWLLKTEWGINQNHATNVGLNLVKHDQLRAMLGLEYSAINNWLFRYEATLTESVSKPHALPSNLQSQTGQSLHIQHSAFNERLQHNLWLMDLHGNNGRIVRWDIQYDYTDNWAFSAAVVLYDNSAGDSVLYPYRHNDTLNMAATFSF